LAQCCMMGLDVVRRHSYSTKTLWLAVWRPLARA
jgi:hypothetical protein